MDDEERRYIEAVEALIAEVEADRARRPNEALLVDEIHRCRTLLAAVETENGPRD